MSFYINCFHVRAVHSSALDIHFLEISLQAGENEQSELKTDKVTENKRKDILIFINARFHIYVVKKVIYRFFVKSLFLYLKIMHILVM